MKKVTTMILTTLIFASAAMAQTNYKLNFHVQEKGSEQTNVKLSLPLSMIRAMGPTINNAINEAHVEIGDEFEGINFRDMWQEFRNTGNFTWAEISEENAQVSITTENDILFINVEEFGDADVQHINIQFPLALGDALFALDNEIDTESLVTILEDFVGQDLLRITGDVDARIWVAE